MTTPNTDPPRHPLHDWIAAGFTRPIPLLPFDVDAVAGKTKEELPALRGKAPGFKNDRGWRLTKDWPEQVVNEKFADLVARSYPEANCGLVLGHGQVAVDLDIKNPADAELCQAVVNFVFDCIAPTPIRGRSNSPSRVLLYSHQGAPSKATVAFTTPTGHMAKVELLARGQQVVVAGTHDSGAELVWKLPPVNGADWADGQPQAHALAPVTTEQWADLPDALAEFVAAQGCEVGSTTTNDTGPRSKPSEDDMSASDPLGVIEALEEMGCNPRPGSEPGMYNIDCPWRDEHTTADSESSTVVMLPGPRGYSGYGFRCMHGHCEAAGRNQDGADALLRFLKLGIHGAFKSESAESRSLPEPECHYQHKASGGVFSVSDDGVFFTPDSDGDEPASKMFLSSRIDVLARTRNDASERWGTLIRFPDPAGELHDLCLTNKLFAGDTAELRAMLLSDGAKISSNPKARHKLNEFLQVFPPPITARSVNRTGWTNDGVFVLDDRCIGEGGEVTFLQTDTISARRLFHADGTLEGWRDGLAALCVGNSRLLLSVSMALAAPMLRSLHMESGGVHLYGPSSSGKTTATLAAATVWGPPTERKQSWRATSNGLEVVAALHNDVLLILDEINQASPEQVSEVSYMLGNERGKNRSTASAKLRDPHTWRLLFLSNGEQAMRGYMAQSGRKAKAGQQVRMVDLPAVPGEAESGVFENLHGEPGTTAEDRGGKFADTIKAAGYAHHGHAGPAFVEQLAAHDGVVELVRQFMDEFLAKYLPLDAGEQVRRVGKRFALIAAAGELATKYGITGWPPGEVIKGLAQCLADWISARGTVGSTEEAQVIEQVGAWLAANIARFDTRERVRDDKARPPTNRAGWIEVDGAHRNYFVFVSVYRDEVLQGHELQFANRKLADAGMLKRGGSSRFSQTKNFDGERHQVIRLQLAGGADDDDA